MLKQQKQSQGSCLAICSKEEALAQSPTREEFLRRFSGDKQMSALGNPEACMLENYPSLAVVSQAYGKGTATSFVLVQLQTLNNALPNKIEKLDITKLENVALLLSSDPRFRSLKVSEWMLFFGRLRAGYYTEFYGALDAMKIGSALIKFIAERNKELAYYIEIQNRKERQEYEREYYGGQDYYGQYLDMKEKQ